MLTGVNAKNYRTTISRVSVEDLADLIDIDTINRVEDDGGRPIDNDIISKYYWAVNTIKRNRIRNLHILNNNNSVPVTADESETVAEVKPKTRKPKTTKTKT